MDKRIIWFALIVILVVAAIFVFRNRTNSVALVTPGELITPDFTITPNVIQEGDSIHYEDHTAGATSWHWDFSDGTGGASTQQSGYATYYNSGTFAVRLVINDSIMDSIFVEVRPKGGDVGGPSKLPPQIEGPKIAYIGEPVTFTDKTPGAEHTNWQNFATAEIKRDSKTYTTTFARKGSFTITVTNEKNTGQGIITVKVIDRRPPPQQEIKSPVANNNQTPPPPPPPIIKAHPSNTDLKKLFSYIVTGKEEFTAKYKPIKNAIGDETVPVIIKGTTNAQKKLYGFCQYLNMSTPTVVDVQSDWDDATNAFKTITVTVKDNN